MPEARPRVERPRLLQVFGTAGAGCGLASMPASKLTSKHHGLGTVLLHGVVEVDLPKS